MWLLNVQGPHRIGPFPKGKYEKDFVAHEVVVYKIVREVSRVRLSPISLSLMRAGVPGGGFVKNRPLRRLQPLETKFVFRLHLSYFYVLFKILFNFT